uniref:endo-polygalacturonase n=1 Tax=Albugo laibachii Nc14 TaxID=890382 RepID=F0WD02_9STRA|nr:endopolygalacturonase putative [Albugo laibachii Nc14]|eukprot:CCA19073.1 endopolygalacturonase putative [Albugo laibachii Nc14]
MHITGSNLKISASPFAWFDGKGASYWDGGGYGQGCQKPIFSMFEVKNSTLRGLKILNSPAHAFMIGESYDSSFIDFEVDDSLGDVNDLAENTDGIHLLQSSNIVVIGAKIHNQDDCVCITSGCNVTISNITCIGGGLSVGSIGKNRINEVEKVSFSHSTITSSLYGILIKAWAGMNGTVGHISFEDIVLIDVRKYGIAVTQGWTSQGIESTAKSGVRITDLIMSDVTGNVLEKGQDVAINCAKGGCDNFAWNKVNVLGGKGTHIKHSFVPKGALYAH